MNAVENGCRCCTAIHSTFALGAGVNQDVVNAIRDGQPVPDPQLKALTDFARTMVRDRGRIQESDLQRFFDAGFTKAQSLEIIAALALSVMANYSGHLTNVPPDDAIKPQYR